MSVICGNMFSMARLTAMVFFCNPPSRPRRDCKGIPGIAIVAGAVNDSGPEGAATGVLPWE